MPYDNAYNRKIADEISRIDHAYVQHQEDMANTRSGGSRLGSRTSTSGDYGYGRSGGVRTYRKQGAGFISDLGIPVISGLAGMFGLGRSGAGKSGGNRTVGGGLSGGMCCNCDRNGCRGCGMSAGGKSGGGIVSSIKSLLGFKSKSPSSGVASHLISRVADRVPALARARDVVGMVRQARQYAPTVEEVRSRVSREVDNARANARNMMDERLTNARTRVNKVVQEGRTRVNRAVEDGRSRVKKVVRKVNRVVKPKYDDEYEDDDFSEVYGSGGSGAGKSGGRRLVERSQMQSVIGGGKRIHPLKETPILRRIMDTMGLTLQEAHKHRLAMKAHKRYKHGTQKDGRQVRAKIVREYMAKHGVSLPEASKAVKAKGLYKV